MVISTKRQASTARAATPSAAASGILDVAERLAQTRGYNGFSYADIAAQLGVTKASLHYHFPSKAELGRTLIERYRSLFAAALETIDQQTRQPSEKLRRYVDLYNGVLSNERLCLCGMLAAEHATLPAPMQEELKLFFDANERWLTVVLGDGLRAGAFHFPESANERARVLLGALEGAMLVARSYGSPQRFQAAAAYLLADLEADRRRSGQRQSAARATVRRPR